MYVVEQTEGGFQIIDRAQAPLLNIPDRVVTTIANVPEDDVGSAFYLANIIADVLNEEVRVALKRAEPQDDFRGGIR